MGLGYNEIYCHLECSLGTHEIAAKVRYSPMETGKSVQYNEDRIIY